VHVLLFMLELLFTVLLRCTWCRAPTPSCACKLLMDVLLPLLMDVLLPLLLQGAVCVMQSSCCAVYALTLMPVQQAVAETSQLVQIV
jgi:hypothetical protein